MTLSTGMEDVTYLLVAPFSKRLSTFNGPPSSSAMDGKQTPLMISRDSFTTEELQHEWLELTPPKLEEATVLYAAAVSTFSCDLLVAEVVLKSAPAVITKLETALTQITVETAIRLGFRETPLLWVSRTRISIDHPSDWVGEEAIEFSDANTTINVSWGNNSIRSKSTISATTHERIREGLVDAQALWTALHLVSSKCRRFTKQVTSERSRLPRHSLNSVRSLEDKLLLVDVTYDEVSSLSQGIRRTVAEKQLQAWNFFRALERTSKQVGRVSKLIDHEVESRNSQYQSIVEMILFILGLATIVQTVLSFINTAYAGGVNSVPGGGGGFFEYIRGSNVDLAIGLVTISSALILCFVLIYRWKKQR